MKNFEFLFFRNVSGYFKIFDSWKYFGFQKQWLSEISVGHCIENWNNDLNKTGIFAHVNLLQPAGLLRTKGSDSVLPFIICYSFVVELLNFAQVLTDLSPTFLLNNFFDNIIIKILTFSNSDQANNS